MIKYKMKRRNKSRERERRYNTRIEEKTTKHTKYLSINKNELIQFNVLRCPFNFFMKVPSILFII